VKERDNDREGGRRTDGGERKEAHNGWGGMKKPLEKVWEDSMRVGETMAEGM
jgi:hypothetical protein